MRLIRTLLLASFVTASLISHAAQDDSDVIGFVDVAAGAWSRTSASKKTDSFQGWDASQKGLQLIRTGDVITCQPGAKVRLFLRRLIFILPNKTTKQVKYDTRDVANQLKPEMTFGIEEGKRILAGASKTFGIAKGVGIIWPADGGTFARDDIRFGLDRALPADAKLLLRTNDGVQVFESKISDLPGNTLDPAGVRLTVDTAKLEGHDGKDNPLTYRVTYTLVTERGTRNIDISGKFFAVVRRSKLTEMRAEATRLLPEKTTDPFAGFPDKALEYIAELKNEGMLYEQWDFLREVNSRHPILAGLWNEANSKARRGN